MKRKSVPEFMRLLELYKKNNISMLLAIFMVMLTAAALIALSFPQSGFAFVVEGEDCGLEVTQAEGFTDVSNLNPGDTKSSYLTARNTGDDTLEYFFDIQKTGEEAGSDLVDALRDRDGYGTEPLTEVLEFTVEREGDDAPLFEGLLSDFEELDMGELDPGEEQRIDISVHLPGPEVGNEYQGSNVTAEFRFRADCEDEDYEIRNGAIGGNGGTVGSTLTVRKFHDMNKTSEWDAADPEIVDWTVYINGEEYETPVIVYLEPGEEYSVREEMLDGWEATTATEVDVTLEEGENETVEFGNHQEEMVIPPEPPEVEPEPEKAALIVRKFNDENMDGVWDEGEKEIENWTVYIDGEEISDEPYSTPVFLDDLEPGRYIVEEEIDDDWEPTRDTRVIIELEEGDVEEVVFGNTPDEEIVLPPEDPDAPPDPDAPRTAETPPYFYYGAGMILVLAGALLGRNKFFRKKKQ